jgi:ATP-binding cassette subfamily F protein uup
VQIGSERKHIVSYLEEFLFPGHRAQSPVRMLSGGERNRLLLARLFAQPANLLVLDEPTNDLDIQSLELLEERLQDYKGTLLLVSHDRRFLDNVVTQTLAAEGNGAWREYVGGYSDFLRQRTAATAAPAREAASSRPSDEKPPRARERLSYKEERELAALPAEIESLEREQTELTARMSQPDYHRQGAESLRTDRRRLADLEELLLQRFARWEVLEGQRARLQRDQSRS